MMDKLINPGARKGCVYAPPSKSHCHRLLICAALSKGENYVSCNSLSADILATLRSLRAMGAEATAMEEAIYFSHGLTPSQGRVILPCGESGSTLRFLLPLCGALGIEAEFSMEGRLPQRPLAPLDSLLCSMGMDIQKQGSSLLCKGQLRAGAYTIDASISSQYISGLLFALPLLKGDSTLTLTGNIESAPYIAMTEDALTQSAIGFSRRGRCYTIPGNQQYALPRHCMVEGDCSQSAFFMAMGALSKEGIRIDNYPLVSLQGDKAMLTLLQNFGAKVYSEDCSISVRRGSLHGIEIDGSQIPDLVPALSVVAAGAKGTTLIKNAARLRLKESDRLLATTTMLRSLGGEVEELPDALIIHGGKILHGGCIDSFHDHRIVMAAAAAASICTEPVLVKDALCTDKSYPGFWDTLSQLEYAL